MKRRIIDVKMETWYRFEIETDLPDDELEQAIKRTRYYGGILENDDFEVIDEIGIFPESYEQDLQISPNNSIWIGDPDEDEDDDKE